MIKYSYQLDGETAEIVRTVRRLVGQYQMPLEEKKLRGEAITSDDLDAGTSAARELGFWDISRPIDEGGLSMVTRIAIAEESWKCLVPLVIGGRVTPLLRNLHGVQRERYLDPILTGEQSFCFAQTEPSGGGDPARAVQTSAVKAEGGWIITGTKLWITRFEEADWIMLVARVGSSKGATGLEVFAVPKNVAKLAARKIVMLGGRVTHEIHFDGCFVDDYAKLSDGGSGFKAAQQLLVEARLLVAARACGVAARCIDMMVDYAKQRTTFGIALSERQAVQGMIVDSWVDLDQARLMLFSYGKKADEGHDVRVGGSVMKMIATELVGKIIDRAIQIHGANGCTYENPLAHWYDDQRMSRIYEGPSDVHKYRVIARELLS